MPDTVTETPIPPPSKQEITFDPSLKTSKEIDIKEPSSTSTSTSTSTSSSIDQTTSSNSNSSFLLVGAFSRIGEQHIQTNTSRQDAFIVPSPSKQGVPAMCALFDGHGAVGEQISAFCAAQLPKLIQQQQQDAHDASDEWLPDFDQAYASLNKAVRDNDKWVHAGCTALSIYITSKNYLTAQTGDCVALLASHDPETGSLHVQAMHSALHRLSNQGEMTRLNEQNAEFSGPYLKYGGHKLMVTRDIGNASFGDLVIPTPDCSILERSPNDSFIVMATDGVWEESDSPKHMMSLITRCLVQRYQQSQDDEKNERKLINAVCKDFINSLEARNTLRDDSTIILILLRPIDEIVEMVTKIRDEQQPSHQHHQQEKNNVM